MFVLNADKAQYNITTLNEGKEMNNIERFDMAARSLTPSLGDLLLGLSDEEKNSVREIRLRAENPVAAVTGEGIAFLSESSGRITRVYSSLVRHTDAKEIEEIFHRVCGYSVYAFKDAINRGYITIAGGHRVGIAGTAATENGAVTAVRDISCINLRIAREIKGSADDIFAAHYSKNLSSLIVAGPPSSGKTTVLRDLARQLSGAERGLMKKVFVCDERGEIGAVYCGKAQNDLGINCDLITAYPKGEGIMIGLRSFSPDIIICDEVASGEEISAIKTGVNSGVRFALSIHARDEKDLKSKPALRELLSTGEFDSVILLSGREVCKTEKTFRAGDLLA